MSIPKINVFCQGIKYLNTCLKSDIRQHAKNNNSKTKTFLRDVIEIGRKKVDLTTDSAHFFGVTSNASILGQITNHCCLTYIKSLEHGIIQSFPNMEHINFENIEKLEEAKYSIWKGKRIDDLFERGAAKLSFSAKLFGKRSEEITHSIGIVADKQTQNIYILDSLSEFTQSMYNYRQKLKFLFTNPEGTPSPKLIFSTKPQQTLKEYTCNNWTYANIETVKKALAKGQKIEDTKSLNSILPDNINTILDEQKQFVLDNKKRFLDDFHQRDYKLPDFSR